jgi:hypothetical protein
MMAYDFSYTLVQAVRALPPCAAPAMKEVHHPFRPHAVAQYIVDGHFVCLRCKNEMVRANPICAVVVTIPYGQVLADAISDLDYSGY